MPFALRSLRLGERYSFNYFVPNAIKRPRSTKWVMILLSPTVDENGDFRHAEWIAGIQVRRMRSETSMSAWIPALHAGMTQARIVLKLTE
jgi:hypothetical protein